MVRAPNVSRFAREFFGQWLGYRDFLTQESMNRTVFPSIGLAMEDFDPIGRARSKDLAGRSIDDMVSLPNGKEARGVPTFADHPAKHRKHEFTKTLGIKFLGYARDDRCRCPTSHSWKKMQIRLEKGDYKLSRLFEMVATSPQFRMQRRDDFSPSKFMADRSPGDTK